MTDAFLQGLGAEQTAAQKYESGTDSFLDGLYADGTASRSEKYERGTDPFLDGVYDHIYQESRVTEADGSFEIDPLTVFDDVDNFHQADEDTIHAMMVRDCRAAALEANEDPDEWERALVEEIDQEQDEIFDEDS